MTLDINALQPAIEALVKIVAESDAGEGHMVGRDKEGVAEYAIIVLQGEGTQEVLDAVEAVADSWHRE